MVRPVCRASGPSARHHGQWNISETAALWILTAAGLSSHILAYVLEEFSKGHNAIPVEVSFAPKPFEKEVREDSVPAPPLVFKRELIRVSRGHHQAPRRREQALEPACNVVAVGSAHDIAVCRSC